MSDWVKGGVNRCGIQVSVLKYADDLVLLADDPQVLQRMINRLERYCGLWNLRVNLGKSKIMVFQRGGKRGKYEKWKYGDEEIEIVS